MDSGSEKRRWLTLRRERAIVLLMVALALLIGFRFFMSDPRAGHMVVTLPGGYESPFLSCPFRALTSLPCPICGFSRAAALMVRGYPLQSFRANPLGPFTVLGAVVGIVWAIYVLFAEEKARRENDRASPKESDSRRVSMVVLVLLAVAWVINLARHFELIRW